MNWTWQLTAGGQTSSREKCPPIEWVTAALLLALAGGAPFKAEFWPADNQDVSNPPMEESA